MQDIKNIAYKFILKEEISELPITFDRIVQIADKNGWAISSYSESKQFFENFKKRHGIDLLAYAETKDAFTITNLSVPAIFYRDELGNFQKIYALLHEVGHIYIQHTSSGGVLGLDKDSTVTAQQEQEANTFAREVCAPLPVLKKSHIHSVQEIERAGLLKKDHAIMQFVDLSESLKDYYDTQIENEVSRQFKDYIRGANLANSKRKAKTYRLIVAAFFIGVALAVGITAAVMNAHYNNVSSGENIPAVNSGNVGANITAPIPLTETVYVTRTGEKYHVDGCRYIKGKDDLKDMSVDEAEKAGYEPCSVCIK